MEYRTVSLADQIFERLESDILKGIYQRGDTITELQLCSQLGVSRTPVREALRRLFQEHLIEDTQKGTVVLGISLQDFKDMSAIRIRIEELAMRGFMKNKDENAVKLLNETVDFQEFYLSKKDTEHLKELDGRFHDIIYENCGSRIYRDTLLPLHNKIQKFRWSSIRNPERAASSVKEHKKILNAILNDDEEKAVEALNQHINNAIMRAIEEGVE